MLKLSNLVSSSSSTSSLSKSHQRVTATLLKTVAKMAHVDPSNSNNTNNNKNNAQTGQENPKEEEKEQISLFSSFWGGTTSSISSSSSSTMAATNNAAATVAALQQSIFRRILRDAQSQEFQFRRTLYMHGLYQHALLQAAQDALYSTELLPDYPSAWQQAGDVFSDLWKLPESTLFYQRAIQLDNDDYDENDENGDSSSSRPQRRRLETTLKPVIERLKRRQQLLDQARSYYGWSEDTLRLALDVAATSMKVDLKRP
jgi:tetratricopeptide (TPR) repeat protein